MVSELSSVVIGSPSLIFLGFIIMCLGVGFFFFFNV